MNLENIISSVLNEITLSNKDLKQAVNYKESLITDFINENINLITESSVSNAGMIDDGTGMFYGNAESWMKQSKQRYEHYGLTIIDYIVTSDSQMKYLINNDKGMYNATEVTNFPKGYKGDYTQITKEDFIKWGNRIRQIAGNLGFKFVEFIENKNINKNTDVYEFIDKILLDKTLDKIVVNNETNNETNENIKLNKIEYIEDDTIDSLNEMTISPNYFYKGKHSPFYILDLPKKLQKEIIKNISSDLTIDESDVDFKKIGFKCISANSNKSSFPGKLVLKNGNGKYFFQVFYKNNYDFDVETNIIIQSTKKNVLSHYPKSLGRKNSTASSNINELLSLVFLANPKLTVDNFVETVLSNQTKHISTNVYKVIGNKDELILFDEVSLLLDKDVTPELDIQIGFNNAKAIKNDLKKSQILKLYWTPRGKPANINIKNPSDIIIQLTDNNSIFYQGYSIKYVKTAGEQTQLTSTNIESFYSQLKDTSQLTLLTTVLNDSWNYAVEKVSNRKMSVEEYNIEVEKYNSAKINKIKFVEILQTIPANSISGDIKLIDLIQNVIPNINLYEHKETTLTKEFREIATYFKIFNLDFYKEGFYYNYRNKVINNLIDNLKNKNNFKYFINTIGFYKFGAVIEGETPCPFKLLKGSKSGSTIEEISNNMTLKSALNVKNSSSIHNIKFDYDNKSQSFDVSFTVNNNSYTTNVSLRTKTDKGWRGNTLAIVLHTVNKI